AGGEKGKSHQLIADGRQRGLVSGMRGQPEGSISLSKDEPPQDCEHLPLEEVLVAANDVDRLRLQAIGTFQKSQAVHLGSECEGLVCPESSLAVREGDSPAP